MDKKHVYLTIDDAPSKDFRIKVDYLYNRGIPAVFFCVGSQVLDYKDDVIYAIGKGFTIGNHSLNHNYFSDMDIESCKKSIMLTDEIIEKAYQEAGVDRQYKYFRFPHFDQGGDLSGQAYEDKFSRPIETWSLFPRPRKFQEIQSYLKRLGYHQMPIEGINMAYRHDQDILDNIDVRCTFDQMEYNLDNPHAPYGLSSKQAILNRIDEDEPRMGRALNRSDTSDIILVHDNDHTRDLFFEIIDRYLEKDFDFR